MSDTDLLIERYKNSLLMELEKLVLEQKSKEMEGDYYKAERIGIEIRGLVRAMNKAHEYL